MKKGFVSDIATFAIGLTQLKVSCPPQTGAASKSDVQSVLREVKSAKQFVQSRGQQGTLRGLQSCAALNVLRRESIPLTPDGFFNWLTASEQRLEQEVSAPAPSQPTTISQTNSSSTTSALANFKDTPFLDLPWLNLGDTQITTKELLVGGLLTVLLSREGYRLFTRS